MKKPLGKKLRRLGVVLLPKYRKILSRKPYPPGIKGKRRHAGISEYGKQLQEKQKLQILYNLRDKQLKKYVRTILARKQKIEDTVKELIRKLESRLDSVVFRLGFGTTIKQARQIVSHGFFLVNDKAINVPSYEVRKGDLIKIKPTKMKNRNIENLKTTIKNFKPLKWLDLNIEKMEGKIIDTPNLEESPHPVDLQAVIEFYSR